MRGVVMRGGIVGSCLIWVCAATSMQGLRADDSTSTSARQFSPPIVPGFERFVNEKKFPALDGGRLLLGELNCLSCHQEPNAAAWSIETKQAPILDQVGQRVRVDYVRALLTDPRQTKPGTTMPHLLAGLPEAERAAHVEALVHFLAMTGSPQEQPADPEKVKNGERLFHEVGCLACHAPRNGKEITGSPSVPLGDLAEKYTVPSLTAFLSNPLKARPSGRMPAPNLNKNETEEVAHYLLKELSGIVADPALADLPKISYRYYEGGWSNLPDFSTLKPVAEGQGPAFAGSLARRNENYALVFEAWFQTPVAGRYQFETTSDDGSELLVDGKRVLINDGLHPPQAQQGNVELAKGPHQVTVLFFQAGGGAELGVKMGGPGLPFQPMGPLVAATETELLKPTPNEPAIAERPRFVIQPNLVKQGRELFASLGCASCHQLKERGQPIQTTEATKVLAKPLRELNASGGCLQDAAQSHVPFFGLSEIQRAELVQAIETLRQPVPSKPVDEAQIAATMLRFNCYACHARNQIGGVVEARNALFKTTQQEMGDEGRIPPALDGVGAKLTTNWLNKIFADGSADRPYVRTRMPKFGKQNVGHLQALVERIDTVEAVTVPPIELAERRVKAAGRMMCGDEVFGCIKCHTFKGQKALGIQSIDLTIMTRRLKHDWFHRYLVRPSAYRPGTRMPTAWPQGRSTLRDVLDGDTHKQIEAIWEYLEDSGNARAPSGLNREAIVLSPGTEAVIYRNFIQGAGPRAIAVGYPEKVNLAFDANEMRLALIWQNKFIDASLHWQGRGSGFQGPLGDQLLIFAGSPAFARLENEDAPWPTQPAKEQGYQFKGYRVSKDNRPTFLYNFQDVRVEDFPTGVESTPMLTLKRTLTLKQETPSAGTRLFFRAAVGSKIEKISTETYRVNGDYQIRLESALPPVIVTSNGHQELRLPVDLEQGKAMLVQEITW